MKTKQFVELMKEDQQARSESLLYSELKKIGRRERVRQMTR